MDVSRDFFSKLRSLALTVEKEAKQLERALNGEDAGKCGHRLPRIPTPPRRQRPEPEGPRGSRGVSWALWDGPPCQPRQPRLGFPPAAAR